MARAKLTAHVNSGLADSIRRIARLEDRSVSDVIEDAISRSFERANGEGEYHALLTKLDRLGARLASIERSQETLFELTAHSARFAMSVAPDIPDQDRLDINIRGADRFRNVIAAMVNKLASGRSVWREHFGPQPAPQPSVGAAAE